MIGTALDHALGWHMHRPPGNRRLLMESHRRETEIGLLFPGEPGDPRLHERVLPVQREMEPRLDFNAACRGGENCPSA